VRHVLGFGTDSSLLERNTVAISEAIDQTPWVDPWVRSLFRGVRYDADAWTARGEDFANRVTDEGWKGFHEGLDKARREYTESWQARPDRPEAANRMIAVAMADGRPGESVRMWFDRTVAAEIDFLPAYRKVINSLRTRWGGDPDALARFARECYETRRFDTDVPLMAFEALEQMEYDRIDEEMRARNVKSWLRLKPRPESIYRDEETYNLVAAVLDGYLQSSARTREYARFRSIYSAVAYKAGRYVEARKQLRAAESKLTPEAADTFLEERVEGRIEAFGGPGGDDAVRAERLYESGSLPEADALFAKVSELRRRRLSPIWTAVDSRSASGDLSSGEAIRFCRTGLAGWMPIVGSGRGADGSLVGTSAARGS
jgi:hypothetical protein